MKKIISIIAIISILLLINSSAFAEPFRKELNNEFFKPSSGEEICFSEPLIISVEKADYALSNLLFTNYKGKLGMLFTESKDMVRFEIDSNLIMKDEASLISQKLKDNNKENSIKQGFVDDIILIKYNWDGKDRITSLDFDEDNSTDIFLIG